MLSIPHAALRSLAAWGKPARYHAVCFRISLTPMYSPFTLSCNAACSRIVATTSSFDGFCGIWPVARYSFMSSVGIQNLINHKVDLNETRNIIIVSVTLTLGIGGAILTFGTFSISGIGLSAVIGVLLNLLLTKTEKKED